MNIHLIGVPLWYGCDNPGTEQAYDCFCQAGIKELVSDCGHTLRAAETISVPEDKDKHFDSTMEYLKGTVDACCNLEQAVASAYEEGSFPLILGGDHALGIGSVSGVNHAIPAEDLTVIWVDAHCDINTNEVSDSHHIHGMPLAALLGLGSRKLIDGFGKEDAKILPQNLFYIGSRSVDEPEWDILRQQGIRAFTMDEVKEKGMEACCRELLSLVKTPYIHLSFDVDFMDAAEYHATGLPIPDGPSVADTHKCLSLLLDSGKVRSMDFVEYSPKNDGDRSGLSTCMDLLKTCLEHIN